MNAAVMALARWHARRAVKQQLYAKGIKLQNVKTCEISLAAIQYVEDHPEIIALATERYRYFVESGYLKPPRIRRKPSQ